MFPPFVLDLLYDVDVCVYLGIVLDIELVLETAAAACVNAEVGGGE